jgi:hypothetical protein
VKESKKVGVIRTDENANVLPRMSTAVDKAKVLSLSIIEFVVI